MYKSLKTLVLQRPLTASCCLLFAASLFIYLANGRLAATSDTLPNSLLAFKWLSNGTFNFDEFRQAGTKLPWFLVEAPNGHLTSTYPIGTAIITFPFYFLASIYLKFIHWFQSGSFDFPTIFSNFAAPEFDSTRLRWQKLIAAATTAFSVVVFYQATRIKFSSAIALFSTFIFAFGSLTWVISSQSLWQHTASNLVMIAAMLALFKVERTTGRSRQMLLAIAGFFCGMLPGIRPTGALFSLVLFLHVVITYRKEALFFCLGLPSVLFNLGWNFHYFGFGNLIGGYSNQFANKQSGYEFSLSYFLEALAGLTINPSRGFLIVSPIVALAIPGAITVIKQRQKTDEKLLAGLAIASLILFLQYCVYKPWYGRAPVNFGPRFLTDLLPILAYLSNYPIAQLLHYPVQYVDVEHPLRGCSTSTPQQIHSTQRKKLLSGGVAILLACTIYSTGIQTAANFGDNSNWELIPYNHRYRLWNWQDTEIQRVTHSLYYELKRPIRNHEKYLARLGGTIERVIDSRDRLVQSQLVVAAGVQSRLTVMVKNTGRTRWYGFETGLQRGVARVEVQLCDRQNQPIPNAEPGSLFISGIHKPGQTAAAIGMIAIPKQPGDYRLAMKLVAHRIGDFPNQSSYFVDLKVEPKDNQT
jgi:hypothetical protein